MGIWSRGIGERSQGSELAQCWHNSKKVENGMNRLQGKDLSGVDNHKIGGVTERWPTHLRKCHSPIQVCPEIPGIEM
jgi:hypothetical protein